MVTAYLRDKSRFFWLKWPNPAFPKDPQAKQHFYRSTKVDKDDPDADRKVARQINKIEHDLLRDGVIAAGWQWVRPHLDLVYGDSAGTLRLTVSAWKWVARYLTEQKIKGPDQLAREHVMEYFKWRCGQKKEKSGRSPSRNTALYEVRVLGRILDEAINRNMIEKNVARKTGIKRTASRQKPEMTDEELTAIFAGLEPRPDYMRVPFRIAIETGLRYAETRFDLRRNVNWTADEISIDDPKGGPGRAFKVDMPPTLRIFLRGLRDAGRRWTWEPPQDRTLKPIGMLWREFFDGLGLDHLCFHCTRVTFITRGARTGIPEPVMCTMVNHGNLEIHRIYQRLRVSDARAWREKLNFSALPASFYGASPPPPPAAV